MSSTRHLIAEQVLYRIAAGRPDVSSSVQLADIKPAINQKINQILKAQHFAVTMAIDERIPENLMICTYNNIPVITFGGKKAKATMPVMPVSLPRNVGIYEVASDEYFENLFIPLQAGQSNLLRKQGFLSNLLNQTGFEPYGQDIIFTSDITIDNTTEVHMRLVVMDISLHDDYTPLPLPADMEAQVVEELVKQFAPSERQNEGIVDNYKTK